MLKTFFNELSKKYWNWIFFHTYESTWLSLELFHFKNSTSYNLTFKKKYCWLKYLICKYHFRLDSLTSTVNAFSSFYSVFFLYVFALNKHTTAWCILTEEKNIDVVYFWFMIEKLHKTLSFFMHRRILTLKL
jgi:hypothetical protein